MAKIGRPLLYTPEIAEEICERLSRGEPLAQICRDEHMPAVRTVSLWKKTQEGFSDAFALARDEGFDAIAADCLRIADDGSNDTYVVSDGDGPPIVKTDHDVIARSRLRVDARLKLLAKWDPRRYGDRVQTEHSGSIGLAELVLASYRKDGDG